VGNETKNPGGKPTDSIKTQLHASRVQGKVKGDARSKFGEKEGDNLNSGIGKQLEKSRVEKG